MYGYVYITTNLINNKQYIGKHKSKSFTENYKGSGKLLWKAINKYGVENFKVELMEECFSAEELNSREIYWINYYNAVNSEKFYNLKNGGDGGFAPHSGISHPLYGKRGKLSPNYGKKHKHPHGKIPAISESKRGKKWYNDGQRNLFIYPEDVTDNLIKGMLPKKPRSMEANLKQSEMIRGRICINNGSIERRVKSEELDSFLSKGYVLGRLKI